MAAIIPDKYRKMMPCLTIKIQVIRKVESGYRLPCTTGCPPHVHQLMLDCWKASPNERVPFSVIVKNLDRFIRYLTNIPFLEIFIRDWNEPPCTLYGTSCFTSHIPMDRTWLIINFSDLKILTWDNHIDHHNTVDLVWHWIVTLLIHPLWPDGWKVSDWVTIGSDYSKMDIRPWKILFRCPDGEYSVKSASYHYFQNTLQPSAHPDFQPTYLIRIIISFFQWFTRFGHCLGIRAETSSWSS